jgi:hypothetical protein
MMLSGQVVLIRECPHVQHLEAIPDRSPVRTAGKVNPTDLRISQARGRSATASVAIRHYRIDRDTGPRVPIGILVLHEPVQGLHPVNSIVPTGEAQQVIGHPECKSSPDPYLLYALGERGVAQKPES